jgi:acylpyruvate hydrolase
MKLVSYRKKGALQVGVVDGKNVVDLPGMSDLGAALMQGVDVVAAAKAALSGPGPRTPLDGIAYAPPVTRPNKIVCLGLNYYDHAKEGGRERPEYPWFFYRGSSSLIAQGEPAIRPRVSIQLDYEAELAVVIGRKARHMTHENALDCVLGYSCFNDVSVRDYQRKTGQWTIGKNFDGSGPFGPVLVTADELPPGATGLRVQTRLNGQVMQNANTDDMIWGVAETIVLLTECMTLEPGDVIAMGTPAGVGHARKPPVWMKDGDTVEIDIERVGVLTNPIRDEG